MAKRSEAGPIETRQRANTPACDPLSPHGLQQIIADSLKGQNCKIPGVDRLGVLSGLLKTARMDFIVLSQFREAKAATEQVLGLIDALASATVHYCGDIKVVEQTLVDWNNMLVRADPAAESTLLIAHREGMIKIDRLLSALREARATLYDPKGLLFERAAAQVDRFNAYSPRAADAFIDAVQSVNPGLVIGKASNAGPLPRFLSAIAPHVSAEIVTTAAVKARLNRVK